MIRQHLTALRGRKEKIRWRGTEVTRLEHFSDAVFAFAVTLLIVSLEVPKSFPELMTALRGFVAFGACFAMLVLVFYFVIGPYFVIAELMFRRRERRLLQGATATPARPARST